MNTLTNDILEIMYATWPMIVLTCVVLVTIRIAYLIKNKEKFVFHHDFIILLFVIYILCLFQIVTTQDVPGEHGINITLFKELTRYELGSKLFYKNIIGNILLFVPFGFFTSYLLKLNKKSFIMFLTLLVSLVIETIQLKIGRAFDIDDILLNFIGGFVGYLVYRLFDGLLGDLKDSIKESIMLMLILIFITLIIVFIV